MTEITRRDFLCTSLALAGAAPLLAQERADGLIVHEWGVVTVADGATWASVRSAGATFDAHQAELASHPPDFVHTWTHAVGNKIEEWKNAPVIVTKPVVYFYSDAKIEVTMKVSVPLGRPAVWWPPATDFAPMPVLLSRGRRMMEGGEDPKAPKIDEVKPEKGYLCWKKALVEPTPETAGFRPVTRDHWWHAARQTDAARVTVGGESDRFVFYDALTPVSSSIAIDWSDKDAVAITNIDKRPLPVVIALRVKDRKAAIGMTLDLDAKAKARLALSPGDGSALKKALIAAGLFEKEAAGMFGIWKEEFLEADGYRVLYFMPRPAIDALLPMDITPAPKKLVRVLLAQIECLGPEGAQEAADLIDSLGSRDIDVRERATVRLQKLGPMVERALRRAAADSQDEEIRSRCRWLLGAMGLKP